MPVLEWATDFAARSARLSAAGEPISGLGAPLRTARPMPERARSRRLPATTLPSLIRPSIASAVRMARSPPAPVSSSFRRPFAEPQVITTLVPMVRSKSGARSSITVFRPLVQSTRIAAFLSRFPSHLRANSPQAAAAEDAASLTPDGRRCHFYTASGRATLRMPGARRAGGQDGTMDSESARMSSAAEARYRIDYPNSKPRVVKVVALDAASEHVVKRVAERQWQRATFFTSINFAGTPTKAEPGSGRVSGLRTMELPRWPLAPLDSAAGG